jgi:hypothetical protein
MSYAGEPVLRERLQIRAARLNTPYLRIRGPTRDLEPVAELVERSADGGRHVCPRSVFRAVLRTDAPERVVHSNYDQGGRARTQNFSLAPKDGCTSVCEANNHRPYLINARLSIPG